MIYQYKCSLCYRNTEICKSVSECDKDEYCECGNILDKIYSVQVNGGRAFGKTLRVNGRDIVSVNEYGPVKPKQTNNYDLTDKEMQHISEMDQLVGDYTRDGALKDA